MGYQVVQLKAGQLSRLIHHEYGRTLDLEIGRKKSLKMMKAKKLNVKITAKTFH